MELKGKTALITGAGGGIGLAIARELSGLGMRLCLCGRDEDKLRRAAETCGGAAILPGDLLDDEYLFSLPDRAADALGGLHVLINNAGLAQRGPMEEVSAEEFDRVWRTDVRAPYILCQKALPHLRASGCGTVVNIASVTAHSGYPMQSAYACAKHGLLGFSKSLASEVYAQGVRVHVISPGAVATGMVELARPDLRGADMIRPEDVAQAVSYLLSHRDGAVIDEIRLHRSGKEPFV